MLVYQCYKIISQISPLHSEIMDAIECCVRTSLISFRVSSSTLGFLCFFFFRARRRRDLRVKSSERGGCNGNTVIVVGVELLINKESASSTCSQHDQS